MPVIVSKLGSQIGAFLQDRPYWAAKLDQDDGGSRWICELDQVSDLRRATKRDMDWTLDVVGSGDHKRIKELWMFCPKTRYSPLGNTATLRFRLPQERQRAFVLKRGSLSLFHRSLDYLIIGKVTDDLVGSCECFIWDDKLRVMSSPYHTNVRNFTAWRDGVMPIGKLSYDVLGLTLKN